MATAFETGKKKFKQKSTFMSLSSRCVDSKKTQHITVSFEQINRGVLLVALEENLVLLKHEVFNFANLNKASVLTLNQSQKYFSLWLEALNTFLQRVTIYFHGLPFALPLMLTYLYGSFMPFLTHLCYQLINASATVCLPTISVK